MVEFEKPTSSPIASFAFFPIMIEEEKPLPIIFAKRCELTKKSFPKINCPLFETKRKP
jgi:hypothetical protein